MTKTETCRKCGKQFLLTFKEAPGSFTESDSYHCPYCYEEYKYRESGTYSTKKIGKDEEL